METSGANTPPQRGSRALASHVEVVNRVIATGLTCRGVAMSMNGMGLKPVQLVNDQIWWVGVE